ncbi:MAG: hypothetical protein QGG14_03090 [Planctomycetota bacterium]|nr:hypothetical protein [Planctomycetota bacterium]
MKTASLALASLTLTAGLLAQGNYLRFGKGCAGSRGVPILAATGEHKIGATTTVQVANLLPSQPAMLFIGASDKLWFGKIPLPFDLAAVGMTGCTQYISTEISVATTTGPGFVTYKFVVPLRRELAGLIMFHQYYALDPGAKRPSRSVVSNAGKLTVGVACKDGKVIKDSNKLSLTIPPITGINNPPIDAVINFTGTVQQKCCSGPFVPTKGCVFNGAGDIAGTTPDFTIKVPPEMSKAVSDAACAEVRKYTLGIVRCTIAMDSMRVKGARLGGKLGVSVDECRKKFNWSGGGALTFGSIESKATVRFTVKILFSFNFSVDLDLSGRPTGAWAIANNKLVASGKLTQVRAAKTFTIPVINQKCTFDYTATTNKLQGSTDPVDLPKPPIGCN